MNDEIMINPARLPMEPPIIEPRATTEKRIQQKMSHLSS